MPDLIVVASERRLEVLESPLVVSCAEYLVGEHGDDSMHFHVLCGENGWWVEWGWAVLDGHAYADLPGQPHDHWGKDLEEVMELVTLTSMRDDSPLVNEYEDAWGGLAPGAAWMGDWPDWYEWPR